MKLFFPLVLLQCVPWLSAALDVEATEGLQYLGSFDGAASQKCGDSRRVMLDTPIWTDRLELVVTAFQNWPSLRIGVNDEQVAIANVNASSSYGPNCDAGLAALPADHGCSTTCCSSLGWCGAQKQNGDRLVIELEDITYVTSLVVQGIYGGAQWGRVRTFDLYGKPESAAPSLSLIPSTSPAPSSAPSVLSGWRSLGSFSGAASQSCGDSRKVVLRNPIWVSRLELVVTAFDRWPSLRIGVNDEQVAIANVNASSSYGPNCDAGLATLPAAHGCSATCCSSLGWCGAEKKAGDSLVIEFAEITYVTSLVVQGIYGGDRWGTVLSFDLYGDVPLASATPSMSPRPSAGPSLGPSILSSGTPSVYPTAKPSLGPSTLPSATPSIDPTAQPSLRPSTLPSGAPSMNPTAKPSLRSSTLPSGAPSIDPTAKPSLGPSTLPSATPSIHPTGMPSLRPSTLPSVTPSIHPTAMPSIDPTVAPTLDSSSAPSIAASAAPTNTPECPCRALQLLCRLQNPDLC